MTEAELYLHKQLWETMAEEKAALQKKWNELQKKK
jgi:hypothetical protein